MPYTVLYCEVTYLRIQLIVMLGTWSERCYLLAVVLPLRDSLQGRVGGGFLPIVSFTCHKSKHVALMLYLTL